MCHLQAESDIEEEMAAMESADEDDEDERPLAEVGFGASSIADDCHMLVTRHAMHTTGCMLLYFGKQHLALLCNMIQMSAL